MAADPPALAEYVDANGNTWQLSEAAAKRLGYKRVAAARAEAKVIESEPPGKPATRRTATTK